MLLAVNFPLSQCWSVSHCLDASQATLMKSAALPVRGNNSCRWQMRTDFLEVRTWQLEDKSREQRDPIRPQAHATC